MELLLINHPLDCPVCDKGGECPLQNQAMSQRPRASAGSRTSSAPSPSRSTSPRQVLLDRERCVLCARCTRFSDQIAGDPFIALRRARRAAADRHLRGAAVRVLLLRQHRADLPGRRADRRGVPVPVPPVRPGLHPERLRALRQRLRHPHRPPPRRGAAPDGRRTTRRSTRSGTATRAAGRSPTPTLADRIDRCRWSATTSGELQVASLARGARRRGPRPDRRARRQGRRRARRRPGHRRGRLRLRQVRPNRAAAPTTSTSAPARTRRRRPHFLASHVVATGPDGGAVTYADLEARHDRPPRRVRARGRVARSSSCACARPSASTRPPCTPSRPSRPAAWTSWAAR